MSHPLSHKGSVKEAQAGEFGIDVSTNTERKTGFRQKTTTFEINFVSL